MSKKTKHTLGPWIVDDDNEGTVFILMGTAINCSWRYEPQHKIVVVEEMEDGVQLAEASANARLIAAAPDLLAVLKEVAESSEYWSEYDVPLGIHDRIAAAIAKAEGE